MAFNYKSNNAAGSVSLPNISFHCSFWSSVSLPQKIDFEVIADLDHLALNFLEVAGFLCLFEQRLNLLMRLHDQTHELLPLIFLEVVKFPGLPITKPLALQF